MVIRQDPEEDFFRVDVEEARRLIDSGEVEIVDVREPWEFEQGHIPNARLVPLNTLLSQPHDYLQRDGLLMVCAVGQRSAVASEMASAMGFKRVYNLEGGTTQWVQSGLPVDH